MSNRTPTTLAKRQREMDKKRWAEEKRRRRAARKEAGGQEPMPVTECRPFVDEY